MDPSSLFTLFQSSYDDILSQFPDADPSTASAKIVASGGETSSASLDLSVSANDGAITSSATAVVEADGKQVETTASTDGSGQTSTSLDVATSVDQQGSDTIFSATADAQTGEGGTASTNVVATGFGPEEIVKDETISEEPTTSSTEFEAASVQNVEPELLQLALSDEQTGTWSSDVDWLL